MNIKMPKLTKKQQQYVIMGVVIVISYFYAYWKYMFLPVNSRIAKLSTELDEVTIQVEKMKHQAMRLPVLQKEHDTLQKELAGLEKKLPQKKDVSGIIKFVSSEATRYDVSIMNFFPGSETVQEYYIEYPFELNVTGGFHNMGYFLAAIGQGERLFTAGDLKIGGPSISSAGVATVQVKFTLKAYAYKT